MKRTLFRTALLGLTLGACASGSSNPPPSSGPAAAQGAPSLTWDPGKRTLTCLGTATTLRLGEGWTVQVVSPEEVRAGSGTAQGLLVRAGQDGGGLEEVLHDIARIHETTVGPLPESLEVRELTSSGGKRIRVRYAAPAKPDQEYRLTYRLSARNNQTCRIAGLEPESQNAGAVAQVVESAVDPARDLAEQGPDRGGIADWEALRHLLGAGFQRMKP